LTWGRTSSIIVGGGFAVARFAAPIGISDFRELRRRRATYVDKTSFVAELVCSPTKVLLLPRPRRFGKTLNLSTLRYFLESSPEDRGPLFEGLRVWASDEARGHFGRYPVVELSFKGVKELRWIDSFACIQRELAFLCERHVYLLGDPRLGPTSRAALERMLNLEGSLADCGGFLRWFTRALAEHHGAPVAVLIDEYDTPIHAAYLHGYYDEAITFFRAFLGGGLKDNDHLFKGVVTGILRIAKESIFSDLNHLSVHTTLDNKYASAFGFTEPEVEHLAELAGATHRLDLIREWYEGYRFGGHVIYNPWSVLNYLNEPDRPARPFWRLTGSDSILHQLLVRHGLDLADWEALLAGEGLCKPILEATALGDLDRSGAALWGFLLFSGYLTATDPDYDGVDVRATLRIPNREVRGVYQSVFARIIEDPLDSPNQSDALLRALLHADIEAVSGYLTRVLAEQASYHDFPRVSGEALYHAFVLGLLVRFGGDHQVRSNRESGYGRADVLIIPRRPGAPGVVLELNVLGDEETVDDALESALAQITQRDYVAELRAAGAEPANALAIVFDGKRAHVRSL